MPLRKAKSKKAILIAVYISVFVVVLFYIKPFFGQPISRNLFKPRPSVPRPLDSAFQHEPNIAGDDDSRCRASNARLSDLQERYGLDNTFQYLRRVIHFTREPDVQRQSLAKLSQRLLKKDFQYVQLKPQLKNVGSSCAEAIEVPVSASAFPQDVDASELMFGVSTTFDRFTEYATLLINDWSFWLTDGSQRSNGGKLILMLLDANPEQLRLAKAALNKAGIDADTYASDSSLPMAARNMALIPTMFTHAEARKKKWLVLCDDDTYFPNMHALIVKLANHDASSDMYIGALSEDSLATQKHGSQAFGGAGIFLSLSTAEKITKNFDECSSEKKVEQAGSQGDRLLRQCIQEHSEIQLTISQDLWQLDIFGDPSGFYEWGIKPLSLHHYRSWHQATPNDLTKLAYICGEDCTLQRFQTFDDFIISGYSIAHYPGGINFDTNHVEKTFHAETEKGWNFDYKMGSQRSSLSQTGRKIAWKLEEAIVQQDGSVLQTYVRRANDARWVDADGKPMDEHDSVIELVWAPGR